MIDTEWNEEASPHKTVVILSFPGSSSSEKKLGPRTRVGLGCREGAAGRGLRGGGWLPEDARGALCLLLIIYAEILGLAACRYGVTFETHILNSHFL